MESCPDTIVVSKNVAMYELLLDKISVFRLMRLDNLPNISNVIELKTKTKQGTTQSNSESSRTHI